MSEKDYALQTNLWHSNARSVVAALLSLDILGWHVLLFGVIKAGVSSLRRLDCGKGVDLEDVAWLEGEGCM